MSPSRGSVVRRKIRFLKQLLHRGVEDPDDIREQIRSLELSLQFTTRHVKENIIMLHMNENKTTAKYLDKPTDLKSYANKYPQQQVCNFGLPSYGAENLTLPGQLYLDIYGFTQSMPAEIRELSPPSEQFAALNMLLRTCGGTLQGLDDLFLTHNNLLVELEHIIEHGVPTTKRPTVNEEVLIVESCTPIDISITPTLHSVSWAEEVEALDLYTVDTSIVPTFVSQVVTNDDFDIISDQLPQFEQHFAQPVDEYLPLQHPSCCFHAVYDPVKPSLIISNIIKCLQVKCGPSSGVVGMYLTRYSVRYKERYSSDVIRCKWKPETTTLVVAH